MQNLKPKQNPTKLTDTENGLVVARGKEWKVGEMGEEGQREQTSPYKININVWGGNVQNCDYIYNTVLHISKLLREKILKLYNSYLRRQMLTRHCGVTSQYIQISNHHVHLKLI